MALTAMPSTVVMMVEPPGEPKAITVPSGAKAMVGAMLLRGRLPGSGALG